jgi:small subunit ribosomal protein S8
MASTDPIADFLTRIRNSFMARHESLNVPHSVIKEELVRILKEEGYIESYKANENGAFKELSILLKYNRDKDPAVKKMQRVSRPGRRIYVRKDDIPVVLGGLGINILSTSKGLMTGKKAREMSIGGEILCEIY